MPSTPETPTGRDVSAASNECRMNALKNRKENDWFGHDAGSKTPSNQRVTSASCGARTPNKTRESEQWFRFDANGSSASKNKPETTSRAKARATGEQQDWYKHGPEVPDPPSLDTKSKTRSRRSACSEVRQRATDSNDWFRHDHKHGPSASGSRTPIKVTSPTALWTVAPANGKTPAELGSTPRPRSRLPGPEADEYYRRDKIGTSAEWFSHEHPRGDDAASGGSGNVRIRRTPEGGEIASRLKGESEDWFRHDEDRKYVTPAPVVKGNSPLTRELKERAQGREIKQIFHMEENLRSTWVARPPLLDDLGSPATPTTTSTETPSTVAVANGNASADVIQDKMGNLALSTEQSATNDEQ